MQNTEAITEPVIKEVLLVWESGDETCDPHWQIYLKPQEEISEITEDQWLSLGDL